jgi:hypothetical protein
MPQTGFMGSQMDGILKFTQVVLAVYP